MMDILSQDEIDELLASISSDYYAYDEPKDNKYEKLLKENKHLKELLKIYLDRSN